MLNNTNKPQFTTPNNIQPKQIDTIIDKTADVVDITTTLLNLAVRNYLTIVEQPRESHFGKLDWDLQRLHPNSPKLLPYKKTLLNTMFTNDDSILMSTLNPSLRPRLNLIHKQLYTNVVTQNWYNNHPNTIQNQ